MSSAPKRRGTGAAARAPLQVREPPGLPWPLRPPQVAGDLPDINVWLALAVQEHPHHRAARQYWSDAVASAPGAAPAPAQPHIWFCRVTMLGLVRLLSQPKVVGKGALPLSGAWSLYQQYRSMSQIGLTAEPTDCDTHLQSLLAGQDLPARLWTDAYLAALARASGLRLVSFDRDFQRFELERCLILPSR